MSVSVNNSNPPRLSDSEYGERVAALKHDLGKYVAWVSANLDDDAWTGPIQDELADALRRDLLRTRTLADGTPEAAWEVWERLTADLGLGGASPYPGDEHLDRVADAVAALRAAEPALRAEGAEALGPHRGPIRAAQATIRAELRALHRQLMRAR